MILDGAAVNIYNAEAWRRKLGIQTGIPIFIQTETPDATGTFIWVQTGLGDGTGFTVWFNE